MQPRPQNPHRGFPWALPILLGTAILFGGAILVLAGPRLPAPSLSITIPASVTMRAPGSVLPRITYIADHAKVRSVVVGSPSGPVPGRWSQSAWVPSHSLAWSTLYAVTVTAFDRATGKQLTRTRFFNTPVRLRTTVSPGNGRKVGMGAAWVVKFKRPLTKAEQQAVLQRLRTSATIPETIGWHWWSSTEVDGRPKHFWPTGDTATLALNLDGLNLGGHLVAGSNRTVSFTVNEDHEIKISARTHRMLVYDSNRLIKNFPVSLGRAGYPTLSGTLVVLFKLPVVFMKSNIIGHPGWYAENVYKDVAISTDGYYLHSAPWDVPDHGHRNVSFGCVEQNPADAAWTYKWVEPGDVVIITGTPYHASEVDGEGDWNLPWSQFIVPASSVTAAPYRRG